MNDRTQPLIAIDVVPIAYSPVVLDLLIGTAVRQFDPFQGEQALPGVLLGSGETLEDAAYRALRDKTGILKIRVRHLLQIGAFDGPLRDPRDKAISIAFLAVIEPHPSPSARWRDWTDDTKLPFDHDRILATAKHVARTRLWTDEPFTRALTGELFTSRDAATIEETLTGKKPEPGNLHRMLTKKGHLTEAGKGTSATTGGRPATAWKWN